MHRQERDAQSFFRYEKYLHVHNSKTCMYEPLFGILSINEFAHCTSG